MKVFNYDNKQHRQGLALCLLDYYREMYDNFIGNLGRAEELIDILYNNNYWCYVVIDNDEVIGFTMCYTYNNYGMTENYLVVDSMYVTPSKRSSRATLLLFTTIGHIMELMNIDCVSTTFNSSKNYRNITTVGGEPIAGVLRISKDTIGARLAKYKKKLNLT